MGFIEEISEVNAFIMPEVIKLKYKGHIMSSVACKHFDETLS